MNNYRFSFYIFILAELSFFLFEPFGFNFYAQLFRFICLLAFLLVFVLNIEKKTFDYFNSKVAIYFIIIIIAYINSISSGSLLLATGSFSRYVLYGIIFVSSWQYDKLLKLWNRLINFHLKFQYIIIILMISQFILGYYLIINGVPRVSGIYFNHASGMALLLGVLIVISHFYQRGFLRIFTISSLIFCLLLSGSRSILIIILFYFICFINLKYIIFIFGILIFVIYKFWHNILNFGTLERLSYSFEHGLDGSINARFGFIDILSRKVDSSDLIFGEGIGGSVAYLRESIGRTVAVHNSFIEILVDFGYIGFIFYLSFILFICFLFLKATFTRRNNLGISLVFVVEIGGVLTNSHYYWVPTFIALAAFYLRDKLYYSNTPVQNV